MDLCLGVVKSDYDADHPGMVLVTIPDFAPGGCEAVWLPVAAPYAGKDYGVYFLPEKDDQVIIGFLGGDNQSGVVLGSLWNQNNTVPANTVTEKNTVRTIVTKGGHKITLTDGDDAAVTVKTKAGHQVVISDKEKKLTVATSDDKEKIVLDQGGGTITIDADKSVSIKAQYIKLNGTLTAKGQSIAMESDGTLDLKSKQTKLEGSTIAIKGQNTEMTGAMVKIESPGILTLKGSMTKIN